MVLQAGTLKDLVSGRYTGPPVKLREAMYQVCKGLHYLHESGVNHRNLNPSSICISCPDANGVVLVKLTGYGVSRILKPGSPFVLWKIAGSKSWNAPETHHATVFTAAMDLYSFGLLLGFSLSNGLHPYGNDKEMRVIRIKQEDSMTLTVGDLKFPPESAVRVYSLINSLLNSKPEVRPSIDFVLEHPFFNFFIPSEGVIIFYSILKMYLS